MKYFLLLLGGLQIADGLLTQFLVGNGVVRESNPLVEPLVLGGNFLFLKVVGAIFSVVVIYFIHRVFPRLAFTAATGMVALYGAVAFWNVLVVLSCWLVTGA